MARRLAVPDRERSTNPLRGGVLAGLHPAQAPDAETAAADPVIVVVMGVAGCGKTTVGEALAQRLGCRFIEGDAFHSAASRQKMASGVALSDDDRWPWLDRLAAELEGHARSGESAVLACSALRRAYRDRLRAGCADLRLVHLRGSEATIAGRLDARQGHYMPPSLLASQLQTLEPPGDAERAITVEVSAGPADLAGRIHAVLNADNGHSG